MPGSLAGKVAFVTGAGSGIGAAAARALAREGVKLGLASLEGDDLGLDAIAQVCDVREYEQVEALVARTVERFGRLDIVFANAGIGIINRPFLDHSVEDLDTVIDTNVKGMLYTIRATLPYLLESDAADIVTLVSQSGIRVLPNESAYCASKFAQWGFTRALDRELVRNGVRVSALLPGGVATRFGFDGRGRTEDTPELTKMLAPDDVARALLYVLTQPRHFRVVDVGLLPMYEEV
jgi:NADP-dependent 3-hydroxy acid dehydrogenase YdfG